MRLYYLIWVDCIVRLKAQPSNRNNWQLLSMIFMTLPMSIDFLFLMAVLQREILGHYFYEVNVPLVDTEYQGVTNFLVLFILPCIAINYLLIFRNRRYEVLIERYKYHNGKLFVTFLAVAIFCPIIIMWVGILFWSR